MSTMAEGTLIRWELRTKYLAGASDYFGGFCATDTIVSHYDFRLHILHATSSMRRPLSTSCLLRRAHRMLEVPNDVDSK